MTSNLTILVTGGAGFIGSNFVRMLLAAGEDRIVNLDKLTYAGNLKNLSGLEDHPRYQFVKGDICDRALVEGLFSAHAVEAVVHFAAESHVDRSVDAPHEFLQANVMGTQVLLDAARKIGVSRFLQVSTDEVYGSLGAQGAFDEESPLAPNSPYAASKAAADLIARSYWRTYRFPVIVTRCSNNYGPYQFPEKLIPLMIANALAEKPLPVYGDGLNVRDWIHVADHCTALIEVLRRGRPGSIYNIGGDGERRNIDLVRQLVLLLDKDESLITFVKDRPGHDRRYAIDASKIRQELGWRPVYTFEDGLQQTIHWYLDHLGWLDEIRSGDYRQYYERMYGEGGRHAAQ